MLEYDTYLKDTSRKRRKIDISERVDTKNKRIKKVQNLTVLMF